jgi:3-oxoacyl-[acyl-carrier protein] reductase
VLINNAGSWRGGPIEKVTDDDMLDVFAVTILGAKNCVAAVAPYMRQASYGHIINVSSAVALIGWRGDAAYASAKAGLIGFTRAAAKDLAPDGIRVNVVAPGFVETDMTHGVSGTQRQRLMDRTLLRSLGEADDIGGMIYALATEGRYMTGSVLTVDGGLVLGNDSPAS